VSRGSSGSIVSGYGLDEGRSRFDPRQRGKDFSSSLCVQTGFGAHPASCTMGTRDPFPGAKARPGRDADHSPRLVLRSRMSRTYTSSTPKLLRDVYWDCFTFLVNKFHIYSIQMFTMFIPVTPRPCLHRRLVANLLLRRPWFAPRSVCV
jgi:hypothetical protein